MNKITTIIVGLVLAGVLTACGGNDEAGGSNTNNEAEANNNEETTEYVEYLKDVYGEDVKYDELDILDMYDLEEEDLQYIDASEEDIEEFEHIAKEPYEAMLKDEDMIAFFAEDEIEDVQIFEIKDYYESEEMEEDGTIDTDIMRRKDVESDDETFDYKFSVVLAEDLEEGENYIVFLGEQENNTEVRAGTSHDVNIIMRDIKEEVYGGDGAGLFEELEPEFDSQGFYAIPIDSDETPEELEVTLERAWEEDSGGNGDEDEFIDFEFTLDGTETSTDEEETEDNASNNNGNDEEEESEESEEEADDGMIPKMFEGLSDEEMMNAIRAELGEEEYQRQLDEGPDFDLEQFRNKEPKNKENWDNPTGTGEAEEVEEEEEITDHNDLTETTPYIEELQAKYGENVSISDLTEEEEFELDQYEYMFLITDEELEESLDD